MSLHGLTTDFGGAGTGVIGPQGNVTAAPEAATPEVGRVQQLKDGWTQFLSNMKTDKNLQAAVLNFGTQLGAADPSQGLIQNIGESFQGSQEVLRQRRGQDAQAKLATQEAARTEETRKAELKKTGAQTKKLGAETKKLGEKTVSKVRSSDLVRTAEALATVDPSFGGDVDKALVHLQKNKGKITPDKFIADFITSNRILFKTDAEAGQAAADAFAAFTAAVEQSSEATDLPSADEEAILKVFPNATPEQIQATLANPAAMAEINNFLGAGAQ